MIRSQTECIWWLYIVQKHCEMFGDGQGWISATFNKAENTNTFSSLFTTNNHYWSFLTNWIVNVPSCSIIIYHYNVILLFYLFIFLLLLFVLLYILFSQCKLCLNLYIAKKTKTTTMTTDTTALCSGHPINIPWIIPLDYSWNLLFLIPNPQPCLCCLSWDPLLWDALKNIFSSLFFILNLNEHPLHWESI